MDDNISSNEMMDFLIYNIEKASFDDKKRIGHYIYSFDSPNNLTQCADSLAINLSNLKENTLKNIYAILWNSINK